MAYKQDVLSGMDMLDLIKRRQEIEATQMAETRAMLADLEKATKAYSDGEELGVRAKVSQQGGTPVAQQVSQAVTGSPVQMVKPSLATPSFNPTADQSGAQSYPVRDPEVQSQPIAEAPSSVGQMIAPVVSKKESATANVGSVAEQAQPVQAATTQQQPAQATQVQPVQAATAQPQNSEFSTDAKSNYQILMEQAKKPWEDRKAQIVAMNLPPQQYFAALQQARTEFDYANKQAADYIAGSMAADELRAKTFKNQAEAAKAQREAADLDRKAKAKLAQGTVQFAQKFGAEKAFTPETVGEILDIEPNKLAQLSAEEYNTYVAQVVKLAESSDTAGRVYEDKAKQIEGRKERKVIGETGYTVDGNGMFYAPDGSRVNNPRVISRLKDEQLAETIRSNKANEGLRGQEIAISRQNAALRAKELEAKLKVDGTKMVQDSKTGQWVVVDSINKSITPATAFTGNTQEEKLETASYVISQIQELLPKSTGSGAGALLDRGAAFIGMSNQGAAAIAELKPLSEILVASVPRFEGPQSNADVKRYEEAAGNLADPAVPIDVRKAALRSVIALHEKAIQQQKARQQKAQSNTPAGNASGGGGWGITEIK